MAAAKWAVERRRRKGARVSVLASTAEDSLDKATEWALRIDLAAAFRLAVEFDWHESVGNHFSAALSQASVS